MYSIIPIHWNIKTAPASPSRSRVGPALYVFSLLVISTQLFILHPTVHTFFQGARHSSTLTILTLTVHTFLQVPSTQSYSSFSTRQCTLFFPKVHATVLSHTVHSFNLYAFHHIFHSPSVSQCTHMYTPQRCMQLLTLTQCSPSSFTPSITLFTHYLSDKAHTS